MGTYKLKDLGGFIVNVFKQNDEDELWQFYLHKIDGSISFKQFKESQTKASKKKKGLTKEEEERQIEWSKQFVKPLNKGGE